MTTPAKFRADVSEFVRKTQLAPDLVLRKLALDAYAGIIKRSPVDTGRFRSSHRLTINRIDPSVEPPRASRSSRAGVTREASPSDLNRVQGTLSRARFGVTVHITNSLPYARRLENGWSAQTNNQPDGIYGATFRELAANLSRAVGEVRRQL